MPYILSDQRPKFDRQIEEIIDQLTDHGFKSADTGELNYVISSIVTSLFYLNKKYKTANDLVGELECVKHELLRRHIDEYESSKMKENGDLRIIHPTPKKV